MILTTAMFALALQLPDAGPDLDVTFPAAATLAGSAPGASTLSWATADGNGATEDMLIRYEDVSGQVGVGTLTDGVRVFGWLGDMVDVNGTIIANSVLERELFAIDVSTGTCAVLTPPYNSTYKSVHSMAYDAAGDRLFAVDANSRQLLLLDYATGAHTKIGNNSLVGYPAVRALAYDSTSDLLYAIDQQTDRLCTINPTTGVPTYVTDVAQVAGARQEELYCRNGTLFLNLGWEDMGGLNRAQLTILDPLTGNLTNVGPELQSLSGHCLLLESLPDSALWSQVAGPGLASFVDDTDFGTDVSFSAPGVYTLQLETFDFDGVSLGVDTVDVVSAGWEAFCSGDGSATACPCGNSAAPGEGCANSTGFGGRLINLGGVSVALDDTVLEASQLPPNKSGIFFVGAFTKNGGLGTTFGDGLRCVQGSPLRRYPFNNTGAGGLMTQPSAASVTQGMIAPGSTWYFQAWHRDAATVCGSQTNMTNAIGITFAP